MRKLKTKMMNIEFIIGTVIGIIGIVPTVGLAINKAKNPKMEVLMTTLTDKSRSNDQHKKALRQISQKMIVNGKRISNEYIDHFVLGKRGKEAVFTDLCIQNDWEPTPDLCKMFLGSDFPYIREKYRAAKLPQSAVLVPAPSTTEGTPVVFLSALLKEKFPTAYQNLTSVLDKHGVEHRLLLGTRDIWCRDYMPVQTASGKLVQFRYEPSYLKGKPEWEASRTDVREVCQMNGLDPIYSNINLDGGNVLLCGGRAILSDRVFAENPELSQEQIVNELTELLEAEIIIIPSLKEDYDYTGHADGMVRFVDRNTLIGNDRDQEFKYWVSGINKVLSRYGLRYIDCPFFCDYKDPKHPDHAIGVYVNYLEVENLIIIPTFGVPGNKDDEALAAFRQAFPHKTIETIDYNEVALEGGVLNCSTWTYIIKK